MWRPLRPRVGGPQEHYAALRLVFPDMRLSSDDSVAQKRKGGPPVEFLRNAERRLHGIRAANEASCNARDRDQSFQEQQVYRDLAVDWRA